MQHRCRWVEQRCITHLGCERLRKAGATVADRCHLRLHAWCAVGAATVGGVGGAGAGAVGWDWVASLLLPPAAAVVCAGEQVRLVHGVRAVLRGR